MEVNDFEILLIDVTFYIDMFKTWYLMGDKNWKKNIIVTSGYFMYVTDGTSMIHKH